VQVVKQGWQGGFRVFVPFAANKHIDYGQKGIGVHVVLPAYFFYGLFTKAVGYAKAAHDKKHGIIVADQVTHLVRCRILVLVEHDCKGKKKIVPRTLHSSC